MKKTTNRYTVLFLSLALLFGKVHASETGTAEDRLMQQSREAALSLGKALKQTLKSSMAKNGPVASIETCHIEAPRITWKISRQKHMMVSRKALKYRNPDNRPDDWELSVLQQFEKRKQQGEPVSALEHGEIVKQNELVVYRYMKAIPTGEVCLSCHGEKLAPPVAAKIRELYPQDKATGFKAGDIRGAFSVTQRIR